MKTRICVLLTSALVLASCSNTDKTLPVVIRDRGDVENRHSKGSWLPHNS